ncbi:MAG: SBBP repeat-containing protein, partial [Anaerolineales bacterium]|nr:SBBP repeat-containing protein [Anaerolineales bacterium]
MVARQLISRILFTLCICALLTGALPSQIAYADNSSIPVNREIMSAPEWEQVKALLPASVSQTSQQAYLKASNTEEGDFLGLVTAISGDTLAVGTYLEDSNSVGVNGDGSNNLAVDSGAVYVFTRSNGVWAQQAYIKASNTEAGDRFGFSVALSGDTLVVGARYEDGSSVGVNGDETDNLATNSGAVYVFKREGVTWSQEAYLKASNTGADDQFGSFVSISNDTIVVGSPLEDGSANIVNGDDDNLRMNSGAAYVFFRDVEWIQQAYLKASINITTDLFGISVSSYGDTVVVGANGGSGKAYIFVRNGSPWGGTWNLQTYLTASNPTPDMQFGTSVALWGDTLVVGADFESSNATGVNGNQADKSMNAAGAAYVFVRNGTTWSQQAYLKASNTDSWDYFGREVAIWGDTIVVGASGESSNATGINGDESNDLATNSGAAYVFSREGTFWSQIAYLKASNSEAYDNFATDVAIDANTIISGGVGEDSSAIGINGDQTNNSATSSGAVYVYTIPNHSSLTWNTFLGGSLGVTEGYDLYTDELGNVYVVGDTSPYYNIGGTYLDPTWGSPIRAYGGAGDGFIAKLDSSGHLLWNTFLGGNQSDGITGVIVDGNGNIYVAGGSSAEWGSPLRLHSGNGYDGFIAKLTSSGELVWNTFLSNSGFSGIDLDDAGNIYLSGSSITNWSIPDVPLSPHHGDYDAFVAKVSSAGDLIWYTFLGGDVRDIANSIVVSPDGNIYIAGTSDSTWGTPVRPFTGIFWNAFAAKLTSSGSLLWNAFLGSGRDTGNDIAIDAGGNVYITGDSSGTWGTPIRPFEMNVPFPINAFVAELDTAGGLTWNTFVGDGGLTEGFGIGVDGNGLVYVDGTTCNSWGSPFRDVSGCTDAFIAMFDSSGNLLTNGFLGGAQTDEGQALHVSSQGELFLSGFSRGGWGYHPIRPYSRGPQDAFVAKLLLFPKVISINRADTSPTSAPTVDFIISFFKPVVGIDTAGPVFDDFELSTTGSISGASITKISGSGDTYTVTVNTGNGTGTIRLDVPTTATITDLIGNTLNELPYSNGEVYDVFKAPITISGNVGVSGVTLSYTDGTAKTVTSGADGSYSFSVPAGWTGTLTPTHTCYTFSPVNRVFSVAVATNQTQNFTPTPNPSCAAVDVRIANQYKGTYYLA